MMVHTNIKDLGLVVSDKKVGHNQVSVEFLVCYQLISGYRLKEKTKSVV